MIDLIILFVVLAIFYGGFRTGNKYATLTIAAKALHAEVKSWMAD